MRKEQTDSFIPLKEKLITKTAKDVEGEESLVSLVVNWCYTDAINAARLNNQIELSGFGKLIVSPYKLERRIAKLENVVKGSQLKLTEGDTSKNWKKRVEGATTLLENLKKRRENEFQGDIRGMEEQSLPSREA